MTQLISPCLTCKHFIDYWVCDAFERIPSDISKGLDDHKKPYPGDNGVQYELVMDGKNGNVGKRNV